MNITKLRGLIQESIQEYLKDIDEAGNRAAVEAKMAKIDEAIKSREDKISRAEALTEDEDMKEMVNTGKISSLKKEIKLFEKAKTKYQKQLDKMDGKKEPKKEIDEFTDPTQDGKGLGIGPIVPPDDFDKPKKENMNESFVRMQKLAGLITESEFKQLNENENDKITIELYQGTTLVGPKENEAAARELAKEIEAEMKNTYKGAKGSGSESNAMDERDDVVYDFEDELNELGFEIE